MPDFDNGPFLHSLYLSGSSSQSLVSYEQSTVQQRRMRLVYYLLRSPIWQRLTRYGGMVAMLAVFVSIHGCLLQAPNGQNAGVVSTSFANTCICPSSCPQVFGHHATGGFKLSTCCDDPMLTMDCVAAKQPHLEFLSLLIARFTLPALLSTHSTRRHFTHCYTSIVTSSFHFHHHGVVPVRVGWLGLLQNHRLWRKLGHSYRVPWQRRPICPTWSKEVCHDLALACTPTDVSWPNLGSCWRHTFDG